MKLLFRWVLNALAILAIARFVDGVELSGFYAALITIVILGLINALIRPVILILTLPVNLLTLGLFTFVINAIMFWFAGTVVNGFSAAWFWPAFIGAVLMTIASWIISALLANDQK